MGKKSFPVLAAMLLVVLPCLEAKKKDLYEKWLKDVAAIITDSEKEEYRRLKKDRDKEDFIQLFWARRDPTPQTEKNEFREEYFERLSYVEKSFLYGYKKGAETDMGKVYLYFGKPRVLHLSPVATGAEQPFPPEIWIYPTQPWMNIPQDTFSFVFTHDGMGYVLDRTRTDNRAMQAFFSYPERALLHPELKELSELRKVVSLSPDSFEGTLIDQVRTTEQDIVQIPFEYTAIFTKAENLSSYLTFLLKLEPGDKLETLPPTLILFGRAESESRGYDFRQEKALLKENGHSLSWAGLPLLPGKYTVFLGLSTPDSSVYSLKREVVTVPNFWTSELAMSSFLATFEVREEKTPQKKEGYDVFSLGPYSLTPHFSQEYSRDQSLNIFYYIYNMAADDNQNCSLLIAMELAWGEQRLQLNPQRRNRHVDEEAVLLEGTQIPLSALPGSGAYELTIRVVDEISQQSASQTLKFTVY